MKTKTIYLCGPITGRTDEECNNWRKMAKQMWRGATLDPMRRDARGHEHENDVMRAVVEQDKLDIMMCDGVLVYYYEPSVGTSMEILFAWEQRKPVVIVDASLGLKPMSLWLRYHADVVVGDLATAVSYLTERLNYR